MLDAWVRGAWDPYFAGLRLGADTASASSAGGKNAEAAVDEEDEDESVTGAPSTYKKVTLQDVYDTSPAGKE